MLKLLIKGRSIHSIVSAAMVFLLIIGVTHSSFANEENVKFELPIGTVAVCKEDTSASLMEVNGEWQALRGQLHTFVFKKVSPNRPPRENAFISCEADGIGDKDYFHDDGTPSLIHRCYDFKRLDTNRTIERTCEEHYAPDGKLMNIYCDFGFSFRPTGDFYSWTNPAIFTYYDLADRPKSLGVTHGTCSKM